MAVQNPFFGKRETEPFQPRHSATSSTGLSSNPSAPASTTPAADDGSAPEEERSVLAGAARMRLTTEAARVGAASAAMLCSGNPQQIHRA